MTNLTKYKNDIKGLVEEGEQLLGLLEGDNENLFEFREKYEIWYSEALCLVKVLLTDRFEDFKSYYESKKGDSLRKAITYTPPRSEGINFENYPFEPAKQIDYARSMFINQLNIVKSCQKRFESSLFDIEQLVQADLFDSELEAAKELCDKGFVRGAGAIAGVVLERHLSQVCKSHSVRVRKKNPSIMDYDDLLKANKIFGVKDWRFIQHLADLRNLCDHDKKVEPQKEDIDELIDGVDKVSKTIF